MILFYGPYSGSITGMSLAFQKVVDSYKADEYYLVDTTRYQNRIVSTLYAIVKSKLLLIFNPGIRVIYFTCSRSFLGSVKDIFLLTVCRLFGKRVVNHLHGADFRDFIDRYPSFLSPLLNWSYRGVNTSIVLTPGMVKEFEGFPNMEKSIVPNFYPADFDKLSTSSNVSFVISFFSNLMWSKGIFDFLEAAKIVSSKNSIAKFQIGGKFMTDRYMNEDMVSQRFFDFLKRNEHLNIHYIGPIEVSKRKDFLEKSSILVLPSHSEGFPLVIPEAMRCGNAIIATKVNYLSEIVNEENGSLVSPKNPKEIAHAILRYLDDRHILKKKQNNNIQVALNNYSESEYIQSVRRVIESVTK